MPEITTLLFDCDNTLVLSEELAFEACADLINEICAARNIDTRFTGESLIQEFVGQNFRGMLTSLQKMYNIEIAPDDMEKYVLKEEDAVIAKLKAALKPCVGADDQLKVLEDSGKYLLAVVSSSALRRVQASVDKVGQDKYFGKRIYSAATSLPKPTSKPDPAIYLHAMKDLGKKPEECVAVEDSKSGATSAFRAGIKTIGYLGAYPEDRQGAMELVLREAGCVNIMHQWTEFPDCLKQIEAGTV